MDTNCRRSQEKKAFMDLRNVCKDDRTGNLKAFVEVLHLVSAIAWVREQKEA